MAEKITLPDGEASLYRSVKFMEGAKEVASGDHMIVQNKQTGHSDDVVILRDGGKPKVKRLVQHMVIQTSSPALPATTGFAHTFADVDAETEKRLLALYDMFPKQAA
jgi:hypothetical protein